MRLDSLSWIIYVLRLFPEFRFWCSCRLNCVRPCGFLMCGWYLYTLCDDCKQSIFYEFFFTGKPGNPTRLPTSLFQKWTVGSTKLFFFSQKKIVACHSLCGNVSESAGYLLWHVSSLFQALGKQNQWLPAYAQRELNWKCTHSTRLPLPMKCWLENTSQEAGGEKWCKILGWKLGILFFFCAKECCILLPREVPSDDQRLLKGK